GDYEKELAPIPQENRTLIEATEEVSPDVVVEIGGYARRALDLYGAGPLTLAGLSNASAVGRFARHRFKNLLRFVIGAKNVSLSGEALTEPALPSAQGTRLVDQEVAVRLEALVAGRPLPSPYDDGQLADFEVEVEAVIVRLRRVVGAVEQAWADGWL